jgi:hypothetical protein
MYSLTAPAVSSSPGSAVASTFAGAGGGAAVDVRGAGAEVVGVELATEELVAVDSVAVESPPEVATTSTTTIAMAAAAAALMPHTRRLSLSN